MKRRLLPGLRFALLAAAAVVVVIWALPTGLAAAPEPGSSEEAPSVRDDDGDAPKTRKRRSKRRRKKARAKKAAEEKAAEKAEAPEPKDATDEDPEATEADAEAEESSEGGDALPPPEPSKPKEITVEVRPEGKVYWIHIEDVIDLGLAPFVSRVVEQANADPEAILLVSEIHTPGGRVDAAVHIRDALLSSKVPTVAFIHTEAISAGALIALAHDYIVMVPGGSIGAATPIQMNQEGGANPVGEKYTSYVRSVFRATAEAKKRDPRVAEAMVDADLVVPGLAPKGKLLTASAQEALAWGIADELVDDGPAFKAALGITGNPVEKLAPNWAEQIARALTHPVASSLLMSIGMLALMMELFSPGFGVKGAIGISCLLLFFFGHYVVQLAGLEELAVFLIGVVLLGVEVFVTPGFGLLGGAGLIAIVASLTMALISLPLDVSIDSGALSGALAQVLGTLAVTVVVGILLARYLMKTPLFGRLVLKDAVMGKAVGFGDDGGAAVRAGDTAEAPDNGARGTAASPLRPSGKVRVGGRSYDATTRGEMIDKGETVVVIGTRGASLVVRTPPPAGPTEVRS